MYLDALTLLGAQHHTVVPVDGNGVYYVLQYERGHGSFWARRQNKSMMIAIIAVVAWRGCMLARTRREVKFLE